jgi:hypothetical protein
MTSTRDREMSIMANVILGNHLAVVVPRQDRDSVRQFYCEVLGGTLTRELDDKDDIEVADNCHIGFLYGDVAVANEFLRTGQAMYLELKSDDVEGMRQQIVDAGVRVLDVPDPHLYFQAPGGQVWRLVGTSEDLSQYERGEDVGSAGAVIRRAQDSTK